MRLPELLRPPLLAEAELAALRLDGEALPLGDALVPLDTADDPPRRAASLAHLTRRSGLVVECETAAWVHCTRAAFTWPVHLCVDVLGRERLGRSQRGRIGPGAVREVRFARSDLVDLGGVVVTTPLRTAIDLARLGRASDPMLLDLLELADVSPQAAAARVNAGRNLAYKHAAIDRLLGLARLKGPA